VNRYYKNEGFLAVSFNYFSMRFFSSRKALHHVTATEECHVVITASGTFIP